MYTMKHLSLGLVVALIPSYGATSTATAYIPAIKARKPVPPELYDSATTLQSYPLQRKLVDMNQDCASIKVLWNDMHSPDIIVLPEVPKLLTEPGSLHQDFVQGAECKAFFFQIFRAFDNPALWNYSCQNLQAVDPTIFDAPSPIDCLFARIDPKDFWNQYYCAGSQLAATPENWNRYGTDANMITFVTGGLDSLGIPWSGIKPDETFSAAVLHQMLNYQGPGCSLEARCDIPLDCARMGNWRAWGFSVNVLKEPWVSFVIASLQNINVQLLNEYNAIKGATISTILAAFNIDDFFPASDSTFALDTLTGLGTIFSIAGGFVPAVGPGLSALGSVLPAIGTFLGSSIDSSSSQNIAQKQFAPKVEEIYHDLTAALDNTAARLFAGESLNGVTITQMMKGGGWVNSTALKALPDIEQQMKIEILSRSIDSLWKTAPSNKIWVQFVALGDFKNYTRKCDADKSGPRNSKYCADSGIYYTYNFIENGDLAGYLGYPWGGEKLPSLDLNLSWVTEASAKTYQLAKSKGLDPFKFNQTQGTTTFLNETVTNNRTDTDLAGYAGRYPGSWTIPVCDTMTWGKDWNYDYTTRDAKGESSEIDILGHTQQIETQHPPCMCGPAGSETKAFVEAAGLTNFHTFYKRCKAALTSHDFAWPDGVQSVDFGFGDIINRP